MVRERRTSDANTATGFLERIARSASFQVVDLGEGAYDVALVPDPLGCTREEADLLAQRYAEWFAKVLTNEGIEDAHRFVPKAERAAARSSRRSPRKLRRKPRTSKKSPKPPKRPPQPATACGRCADLANEPFRPKRAEGWTLALGQGGTRLHIPWRDQDGAWKPLCGGHHVSVLRRVETPFPGPVHPA